MKRLISTRIVPKMRRLCGETEVIWFFNVAYVRRVSPVLRWFRRHMTTYKGPYSQHERNNQLWCGMVPLLMDSSGSIGDFVQNVVI